MYLSAFSRHNCHHEIYSGPVVHLVRAINTAFRFRFKSHLTSAPEAHPPVLLNRPFLCFQNPHCFSLDFESFAQVSLMAVQRIRLMAVNVSWVLVILVLAEMGCAQEPAISPSSGGCDDTISELTPCLSYIMANDTTPPAKDCCSGLKNVVDTNIVCLCTLLASSSSYGITVNQTRAAAMPAACKVQTPPLSACAALAPTPTSSDATGVVSPTAGSNGLTPVLSPSATTGAADGFTTSPISIFTGLLLAGVAQLLV